MNKIVTININYLGENYIIKWNYFISFEEPEIVKLGISIEFLKYFKTKFQNSY